CDDLGLPGCIEGAFPSGVHALIVHPASLGVAQYLIGLVNLDEPRLSVGRGRHIGMEAASQSSIGRFDLAWCRPIGKSENAVKVFHSYNRYAKGVSALDRRLLADL